MPVMPKVSMYLLDTEEDTERKKREQLAKLEAALRGESNG